MDIGRRCLAGLDEVAMWNVADAPSFFAGAAIKHAQSTDARAAILPNIKCKSVPSKERQQVTRRLQRDRRIALGIVAGLHFAG